MDSVPTAAAQQSMRVSHRSDAAVEGAEEFVHGRAAVPRALRNRDHGGKYILDPVIELGNEQVLVLFGSFPLSGIADDTEQPRRLAFCIAHNGALKGDPSHLSSKWVVGRIHHPVLGFTGA